MEQMTKYESQQYQEILSYMNEEPSVVKKAVGVIMEPVSWVVKSIIPTKAIEGALKGANGLAEAFTDERDILRDGGVERIEDLRYKDLELSDRLADNVHDWAIGTATAEGLAAGAAGLVGLIVDVPSLITMAIREIHKIGLCYGYKAQTQQDREFVFSIMSMAGANSVAEKTASVVTLRQLQVILVKTSWKVIEKVGEQSAIHAFLITIRSLARQLGINLTKRKILQAIPVIGAGVGAAVNGNFLDEIGWAARRAFQERWLRENKKIEINAEVEDVEIIEE